MKRLYHVETSVEESRMVGGMGTYGYEATWPVIASDMFGAYELAIEEEKKFHFENRGKNVSVKVVKIHKKGLVRPWRKVGVAI